MKRWQGASFVKPCGTPMLSVVAEGGGAATLLIVQPRHDGSSVARFIANPEQLIEIADALRAAAEVE